MSAAPIKLRHNARSRLDGAASASVLMISYNHAKYVGKAIESVLAQRTTFPVRILIGDDCSSDGTAEVINAYCQRFPDRITDLPRTSNLGMLRNLTSVLEACDGKYVALLEGDDFWVGTDKLQRQVDFLETHSEYSAHAFNAFRCAGDSDPDPSSRYCAFERARDFSIGDLLMFNPAPTCTVLFRNGIIDQFGKWFYGLTMGDWPIHILNARFGPMRYEPEPMGCYRTHAGGVWSTLQPLRQMERMIAARSAIGAVLGPRYSRLVRSLNSVGLIEISEFLEREGDLKGARRYFFKGLRCGSLRRGTGVKRYLSAAARLYAPARARFIWRRA